MPKSNNDNKVDEKYRNVVRSKILKRIYEKSNLDLLNDNDNLGMQKPNVPGKTTKNLIEEPKNFDDQTINQKVKRHLSNEWRQTLERVLNYQQGYIDSKFSVSRKESIRFFINTEWPEAVSESENEEQQKENSKKRKNKNRKHRRTDKYSSNQAIESSEFDPTRILAIRKSKIPWKQNSEILLNSVLTNEFELDIETLEYDEEEMKKLETLFGTRSLARLMREKIALDQLNTNSIFNIYERYVVQDSNQIINQNSLLNRNELAEKSKIFSILLKIWNMFYDTKNFNIVENQLNNLSFVLSIGKIKIDFSKHPQMNSEDKFIKKLMIAFEKYQKSISNQMEQKLKTLNSQINLITDKLRKNGQETVTKEVLMDLNLLQRLQKNRDQLIWERRQSLIDLIQQWSRFQNELDSFPNDNLLNEIDLRLDEVDEINLEQEKQDLNQIIQQKIMIQNLSNKIHDNKNQILNKENEIKETTFLYDGRLPGEPKFKPIELVFPQNFAKKDSSTNILYSIDILIGNRIMATFENINLPRRTFSISWDDRFRSFPVPICLNQNYTIASRESQDPILIDKLQKIRIHEKNPETKSSITVAEIQLKSLPILTMNSEDKFMEVEETFQNSLEKTNKKRSKIVGSIELRMYWSSLPPNLNISDPDLLWMYDEEKRLIKQMDDLDEIDQKLHDIRYLLDEFRLGHDNQYHRQLELMQLLLKQKYHLEISSLYQEKKKQLNRLLSKTENDIPLSEDGIFCTDDEIDQNKRFQIMINRNKGHENYKNYRFIPLTNTDVLLSDVRQDDKEKSSSNVLMEFIRISSKRQLDRLMDDDQQQSSDAMISHDWCADQIVNNQWLQSVVSLLHRIWERSIKFDDQTSMINNEETTHSDKLKEIVYYNEIVREPTFDTMSMNFPLSGFFRSTSTNTNRKLAPSRKNRNKEAISLHGAFDHDVQIHLLVQQATNVPFKVNSELKVIDHISKEVDLSQSSSFVEIKVYPNNQTMSTSISDGSQPNWNESFKFKIKMNPKNNLNLNLFAVNKNDMDQDSDSIKFDEFDMSNQNDISKMERCWLGQLKIPLYALLFCSKLEGLFPLFSPYFLKSYKSPSKKTNQLFSINSGKKRFMDDEVTEDKFSKSVDQIISMKSSISMIDIQLSLFVTINPPIESKIKIIPNYQNLEQIKLVEYCERWLQPLHQRFPTRRFLCLVDNLQHKSVLASRFLNPIKPPTFDDLLPMKFDWKTEKKRSKLSKLTQKENLYISLLIRYVSLIPSLLESSSNLEMSPKFLDRWRNSNIWMDVEQFLTLRMGCQVEHSILLCCFLLYLDKKAYLALGTSSLDGPTAYVIVYPQSEDNDVEEDSGKNSKSKLILIDPKRGQQFFAQDYYCTMISVDCIITSDNIYANIQKNTLPSLVHFNLKRTNHWQPLFSYRNQLVFQDLDVTIQPPSINYGKIQVDWAKAFESKLENHLREQFMNWRRQQTGSYTPFNRFCMQIIKNVLPEFEKHLSLNGNEFHSTKLARIEETISKELNQIYGLHKMIGYPLNANGTMDLDQLARLLYATNLHVTHFGHPNQVEYVLTCYVHPYPADIYSIWIYAAAVTSKPIVA